MSVAPEPPSQPVKVWTTSTTVVPVTATTVDEAAVWRWVAAARKNAEEVRPAHSAGRSRLGTVVVELSPPSSVTTPTLAGAPEPVSDRRCPAGAVKAEIDAVFGSAAPWAESVAWRESNCEPGARNGSSGSAGVFQLLGHDDLLRAACPGRDPSTSWADADCNIRAAFDLYRAAGIAPWRL